MMAWHLQMIISGKVLLRHNVHSIFAYATIVAIQLLAVETPLLLHGRDVAAVIIYGNFNILKMIMVQFILNY